MAINAGAIARTIGNWLTREQKMEPVVDYKSVPSKDAGASSIGWEPLDDGEIQRVKIGLGLMTLKSFNRGH